MGSRARGGESGRRRVPTWLVRLSIPLLLWMFTTVLFGLDLGRLGDDHAATTRRPETGELLYVFPPAASYLSNPFDPDEGQFWRPLYMPWIVASNTLLWNHAAWLNLLDATIYLGVAGALYALLRSLRIGRAAALLAATLFIVYPAYSQVVYWKAASGTTIAVGLTLLAVLAAVAYMRPPRPRWAMLPALAGLGFAVPAFNEQAAPALAALPLFMLAGRRPGTARRPIVLRTATVTVIVGSVCAVYGAMMIISGREAYEPYTLGELPGRAAHMLAELAEALSLQEFAGAALGAGWRALAAAPARGAIGLAFVAAAFVPWLRRVRTEGEAESEAAGEAGERPRRGLIVLAALAALALTLPPVVIIRMYPSWDSRFLFAPGAMLAIALAAGLGGLGAWWRGRSPALRRRLFPVWGAGLAAALVLCAVMMVGSQEPYRRRAEADVAQAAMLRALLPDPVRNAFFMPVAVRDASAAWTRNKEAGSLRWHALGSYSVWQWPWGVRRFLCTAYERSDVRAGYAAGVLPRVLGAEEEGLRYAQILPDARPYRRHAKGGFLVPWDVVVPFLVLEDGTVELVTALELPDGGVVQLEAVRSAVEAGRAPRRRARLEVWEAGGRGPAR